MAGVRRDCPRYQGNDFWMLPMPASFVVDAEGIVRARFIDPDYRKRMAIEDLLSGGAGRGNFTAPSTLVVLLLAPDLAYPFPSSSAIENLGVKRNNSASLRIGGQLRGRQDEGSLQMTANSLSDALHEAYVQARDMDASLGERLQAFADAVRRLGPHFQEAVDKLVARLKEQGVGETAPKPGEPMPLFVLPDETGHLVSLDTLLDKGPVAITFHRG